MGAAFLMATSAIGPGFLTQTALFTSQLGASFGFAILVSILLDMGAQLNIWRIITVSNMRAQDLGNRVLPGAGTALAIIVSIGGLAFNIGNLAGCGLAFNVLFGLSVPLGALLSAIVAAGLFLIREAGRAMDRFAQSLGFLMIALTVYVAIVAHPPLAEAAARTFRPDRIAVIPIVTLVGGTVGGYITFAGAHRLLDAGVRGPGAVSQATHAATTGILLTGVMRVLLFVAALGVVTHHGSLDAANPPASVFRLAAGEVGYRLFGVVMWSAAVTSVVGASYTSTSFLKTLHPFLQHERVVILSFIAAATVLFLLIGRPVNTLVVAGALNALVLPGALAIILLAGQRPALMGDYRHSYWLSVYGAIVVVAMSGLAVSTIILAAAQLSDH